MSDIVVAPRNEECKWWQLRWVGRALGATLLSSSLFGAFFAFFKLKNKDQEVAKVTTFIGCTFTAVAGVWFITKKYWSDPAELAEERTKLLEGKLRDFYTEHGWDRLLKIAGSKDTLVRKFASEIEGNGLYTIWRENKDVLDGLLEHSVISHNELVIRFNQDQTSSIPAIQRINAYGFWVNKVLNIPPQTFTALLTSCQTTFNMSYLQLAEYKVKEMWDKQFLPNDFLRLKLFDALDKNWLSVQKTGHWWLDTGLVTVPEVQAYFDSAWRSITKVDDLFRTYWAWPISAHTTILPGPIYWGLSKIHADWTKAHDDFDKKKSKINSTYNTIEKRAEDLRSNSKNDIEINWAIQKTRLRNLYKDDDQRYQQQVLIEEQAVRKQLKNAEDTYANTINEPKEKRNSKLKSLSKNSQVIFDQVQANYDRLRISGEEPRAIIDPKNPATYLPSMVQHQVPVINVNVINSTGGSGHNTIQVSSIQ